MKSTRYRSNAAAACLAQCLPLTTVSLLQCERQREFKSASEWVGEVEMTDKEIEEVMMVRIRVRNKADAEQRDRDRRTYTTSAVGPHQVIPVKVVAQVDGEPVEQPTFDPYANDVWRKRTQVLKRLRALVTQSIVRHRADTRLAALQQRVAEAAAQGGGAMRELIDKVRAPPASMQVSAACSRVLCRTTAWHRRLGTQ